MDEGKVWPVPSVKKKKIKIVSAYKEEYEKSKPEFWLLITLPLAVIGVCGVFLQFMIVSNMLDIALKCVSGIEFVFSIGVLIYTVFMLATISPAVGAAAYWGMKKAVTKVGEYVFKAVFGLSIICFICSVLVLFIAITC